LLAEHDADLEAPPLPFSRFIPGGFLRWRDHASHAHYKEIFRVAFARDVVRAAEDPLRAGMRESMAAIAAEPSFPPRERIEAMLFPLWTRLFLGVDESERLRDVARALDIRYSHRLHARRARRAVAEATDIVSSAPAQEPSFLAELRRRRRGATDDPAVAGSLYYLLLLTWADMSGLLTWILRMLADHPDSAARVRTDEAFAAPFVRETLRLSQSEYLYRRTLRDVDIGEYRVPRGWLVRVCVREAHRDARVFERPDEFDPDRFRARTFTRDEYSPFGAHRLACLGEHAAIEVARWFTLELARYDVRIVRDGRDEFGSWSHWRPSRKLRVALAPAAV